MAIAPLMVIYCLFIAVAQARYDSRSLR